MSGHVLVDGNNLLHALHAQVVGRHLGRETLVRWLERWAREARQAVTLVFDGPQPKPALFRQMQSSDIEVRFAAPKTADDILVDLIRQVSPSAVRLVSSDTAIQYEARLRRCAVTPSGEFVEELLAMLRAEPNPTGSANRSSEKPGARDQDDKPVPGSDLGLDEWARLFGADGARESPNP